jgi:hypothetical protein
MKDKIGVILGIIAILTFMYGMSKWVDSRYALAAEMKQIQQRLDYKIASDQQQSVQQRIWTIEDRYKNQKMPETVNESYRDLLEQKRLIENKLKVLEQK